MDAHTPQGTLLRRTLLWAEMIGLFAGVPLVIWQRWLRIPWLPLLFGAAVVTGIWMWRVRGWRPARFWKGEPAAERAELKPMLWRFAAAALALTALLAVAAPERLFQPPRGGTFGAWLLPFILIGYPVGSVFVQELIFRGFFFERYRGLFADPRSLIAVNALLFGWAHVFFPTPLVSVPLCIAGGLLFARTYARTGSIRMACLEHALYGDLMFVIGLGEFFLGGGRRAG